MKLQKVDALLGSLTPRQFEKFMHHTSGTLRMRSREWNQAWRNLARRIVGSEAHPDDLDPGWDYLGSDRWTGRWTHYFRLRASPETLWRDTRVRIPASPGWTPKTEQPKRRAA